MNAWPPSLTAVTAAICAAMLLSALLAGLVALLVLGRRLRAARQDLADAAVAKQRFRWLAEHASDVVYETDEQARCLWVSPSVQSALGWAPADLVGQRMAELLHPADLAAADKRRREAMAGDGQGHIEVRYRTASGEWRWMAVAGHVVRTQTGAMHGITALRDVHDAVLARRALEQSERRFRRLLARAPIGTAICDLEGHYLEVNDAMCAVTGLERAQLLTSRWQDTRTPSDQHREESLLKAAMTDGSDQYALRTTVHRSEGAPAVADVSVTVLRDGGGSPFQLIRQIVDVTPTVRAISELAASQERYRLMVENAADVVVVADADDRIEWVSESLTASTGWRPEQVLGQTCLSLIHSDDLAIAEALRPSLLAGQPVNTCVRLVTADGSSRWCDVRLTMLLDSAGEPTRMVAAWRDAHDRVQAEHALAASEQRYRTLASSLRDIVMTFDGHGRWTWVSPSIQQVLGWNPDDLLRHPPDIMHPDDALHAFAAVSELVLAGGQDSRVHRSRMRDVHGNYRWFDTSVTVQLDDAGRLAAVYSASRDVDDVVRAQSTAERERKRFTQMFRQHDAVMLLVADDGEIVDANEAAAQFYGYWVEQLRGMSISSIAVRADKGAGQHMHADCGEPDPFICVHRLADGSLRHVEVHASPIETNEGRLRFAVIHDVTQALATRQALQASEERFRLAMANAPVATLLVELDGRIVQSNDAATEMLGYDSDELGALHLEDLQVQEQGQVSLADLRALHDSLGATLSREQSFHTRDGELRWAQVSVSLVRGEGLAPAHYIVQLLDLTDVHAARDELAYRALHDPLTGLANRAMFDEQLQRAFSRARRRDSTLAVLFCDLDAFKLINDRYGHETGDVVLKTVAARLTDAVRTDDLVARLGGDEFVVLAEDLPGPDAGTALAERILTALRAPIVLPTGTITPATSIGVAYRLKGQDDASLLRRADTAMYRAKAAGKNQWVLDEPARL